MANQYITLSSRENQARGIGRYALDFLSDKIGSPTDSVFAKTELFHLDSVGCAVAAFGCGASAPKLLREEALCYPANAKGLANTQEAAYCFGSNVAVKPEKAVLANCSAVRELDANGTNFGYNPQTGDQRGEFGHNDFYPVVVAAAALAGLDGRQLLRAMICLDEIRGRLAEVFALKDYKIDHVVHGAIASAAVYGALLGASEEQIESAIGLLVAHYVPFRAIRSGHQLSDSKGASAAIITEMAVLSMQRAMRGFVGPADIFRNRQALFCLFEPPAGENESPFDLTLATEGDDFAAMGMHFKLGMYEHQSAGAIQGLLNSLIANPKVLEDVDKLQSIQISIYEPAFSIIGDPAKRDPQTRQSADHSMVYIIATLLRKAYQTGSADWRTLMLTVDDYDEASLFDPMTRQLMKKIEFCHGGQEYDDRYPDGIPTKLEIEHVDLGRLNGPLVMYPMGHARCESQELESLLEHKFRLFSSQGVEDVDALYQRLSGLVDQTPEEVRRLYDFPINFC